MPSNRRTLFMGVAIAGLAAWVGITYWPPRASQAAPAQDITAGSLQRRLELPEEIVSMLRAFEGSEQAVPHAWPTSPFTNQPSGAERPAAPPTERPAPARPGSYQLAAILSGAQPMALINGRVVRIGEAIDQYATLVAVDEQQVLLEIREEHFVLTLPQ